MLARPCSSALTASAQTTLGLQQTLQTLQTRQEEPQVFHCLRGPHWRTGSEPSVNPPCPGGGAALPLARGQSETQVYHPGPRKSEPTFSIASAVFTGTVDFSTTILLVVDTEAIMRAAPSQYVKSAALPAPTPRVFVGVFTLRAHSNRVHRCFVTTHALTVRQVCSLARAHAVSVTGLFALHAWTNRTCLWLGAAPSPDTSCSRLACAHAARFSSYLHSRIRL